MAMEPIELVICDMAGTTVEDAGQVPAAFALALKEHGIQVSPAEINAVRGASKRQAILKLLPPGPDLQKRADETYQTFVRHLTAAFNAGVRPIAGAERTFAFLRERHIKLALNTGFDREITGLLLASLGWNRGTVDAVVCGDEVPEGRPAPYLIFRALEATKVTSVHRVAVLGDTTLDLQAAFHAGVCWNIGVLSGAHSHEQLQAQPHTHLLASIADLPSLWP